MLVLLVLAMLAPQAPGQVDNRPASRRADERQAIGQRLPTCASSLSMSAAALSAWTSQGRLNSWLQLHWKMLVMILHQT